MRAAQTAADLAQGARQILHVKENDGRYEQREDLGDHEPTDHCHTKRLAKLGACSCTDGDGDRTHEGSKGCHHDRPETHETGFTNGIGRGFTGSLADKREVNHHDRILLDDTDQHQDADNRNHAKIVAEQLKRGERARRRRRQAGQDGKRMDETLVKDAEHNIYRQDRCTHKQAPDWQATVGTPGQYL